MKDFEEHEERPVIDSKYRKILIAAKRSKQLQKGAQARVNLPNAKSTRVALAELENGLVDFELTEQVEK